MKRAAIAILAAALAGCASVKICERGGKTMVDIENSGWYLLHFVPLASGDPYWPNENLCRMFTSTVTLENNIMMLERTAKKHGAKTAKNLNSYITDENVLIMLFTRHAYHTSAELVFDTPAEEEAPETKEETCESAAM